MKIAIRAANFVLKDLTLILCIKMNFSVIRCRRLDEWVYVGTIFSLSNTLFNEMVHPRVCLAH